SNLGGKTTPEKLAAFLANPLAVDPSGRMPHMLLDGKEAMDLANYLCSGKGPSIRHELPKEPAKDQLLTPFNPLDPRPDTLAAFASLPSAKQWAHPGQRLVIDKGCKNCHTIAPGGQSFANVFANASFDDIKNPKKHAQGCLAGDPAKRGPAPHFPLAQDDRMA